MFQFIRKVQRSLRHAASLGNGPRRRRSLSTSDSLESRTLLASLVSATKISYQDADGDNVTVTLSKAVLTAGNVNSIFTFDVGTVDGSNTTKQQLRTINLTGVAGVAGTTITTAAVRSATTGGDGFAALGQINATGIDIGAVTIDGDLGRILAGDATTTTQGLGALKVHSMGRYGTLSGATNLDTVIQGKLASLTTKSDVKETFIDVQGGANGQIGSITIGGSLIGGTAVSTGRIHSSGDTGAVKVTGDIRGGAGGSSASISSGGKLASVTIGGALIGDSGAGSGALFSSSDMGTVVITGDVQGGTAPYSGSIRSGFGKLAGVTIGGSLIGGNGFASGQIYSEHDIGAVNITANIVGGSAQAAIGVQHASGAIVARFSHLGSVTIGGSIIGGVGYNSGLIACINMGPLKITGDVRGGTGLYSGIIHASGKLASVTIDGSILGDTGSVGGQISASDDIGPINVKGNIRGGSGVATGSIVGFGKITSVTIGGSLIGGTGEDSGRVRSVLDMGAVKITGDVIGGGGVRTGLVISEGKLASVTIGGSLIGGTAEDSGHVRSVLDMGAVKITGDVRGGSGLGSGAIISSAKLDSLAIGGALIGATGSISGHVFSNGDMGAVSVKGDLIGSSGLFTGVIKAQGKLASITIGGSILGGSRSNSGYVSAGGELTTATINGNIRGGSMDGNVSLQNTGLVTASRIGTLTLNGSLIAGTNNTSGSFLSNGAISAANDIANLTIKGSVIGNSTHRALINARGQLAPSGTTDLAIGKLTINGRVEHGLIVAGSFEAIAIANADAQIGPVVIGGDWIASSLAAGATPGADAFYGNSNDAKLSGVGVKDVATVFSKITSIVIGGQVMGTPTLVNDHFGFVAENIGSFKVKGGTTTYSLTAGNSNDDILLSLIFGGLIGGDTRLNEI